MSTYYGIHDLNRARRSAYKHAKYNGWLASPRRKKRQRKKTPPFGLIFFGIAMFIIVIMSLIDTFKYH